MVHNEENKNNKKSLAAEVTLAEGVTGSCFRRERNLG